VPRRSIYFVEKRWLVGMGGNGILEFDTVESENTICFATGAEGTVVAFGIDIMWEDVFTLLPLF
jgi:hypothetical protein